MFWMCPEGSEIRIQPKTLQNLLQNLFSNIECYFDIDLEIWGWSSSPVLNFALLWNSMSVLGSRVGWLVALQGTSMKQAGLCACRSQHAEGLRRGFRCSVRSQKAETRQSTDAHTSATQTDFALVLLDSPLTNLFAWLLMQVWGILEVELALYFLCTGPGSLCPKRGSIWKINLKIFVRWKFITTRPMDKATQAREVCCQLNLPLGQRVGPVLLRT